MAARRWWSRLVDGTHSWGSFDVVLGRHGIRRYRLTVFPPDIDAEDRRLLRVWRSWPLTGGVLSLAAAMCMSSVVSSPGTTLAVSAAVYLGTSAALFALTAQARTRVRSISLTLIKGYGHSADPAAETTRRAWQKLTGVMLAAEDMLQRGTLSPVQYETVWWEVYDRVAALAE